MSISSREVIALSAGLLALSGTGVARASTDNIQLRCPASDQQALVSSMARARTRLVPRGESRVLLCRYTGLLTAHRLVTKLATVRRLAGELNSLDALNLGHHTYSCPADTGEAIIAFFEYRSGTADPVTVGVRGCMSVTNGHMFRLAGITQEGRNLVSQLEQLT